MRFGLTTYCLQNSCSTTELRRLLGAKRGFSPTLFRTGVATGSGRAPHRCNRLYAINLSRIEILGRYKFDFTKAEANREPADASREE